MKTTTVNESDWTKASNPQKHCSEFRTHVNPLSPSEVNHEQDRVVYPEVHL